MSGYVKHTISKWTLGCLALLIAGSAMLYSCSDDTAVDSEVTPRNLFAGVADGKDFKTTGVLSVKDSSDIFIMIGRMLGTQTILAAFNGKAEQEYTIADDGPLATLADYLSDIITDSTAVIDTAILEEIFTDSAQLIPPGSSYIIYGIGEDLYFSSRGNITLSTFDGTINRIHGTMEAEFLNPVEGVKYINAYFEDVFFLDCASLENCVQ